MRSCVINKLHSAKEVYHCSNNLGKKGVKGKGRREEGRGRGRREEGEGEGEEEG